MDFTHIAVKSKNISAAFFGRQSKLWLWFIYYWKKQVKTHVPGLNRASDKQIWHPQVEKLATTSMNLNFRMGCKEMGSMNHQTSFYHLSLFFLNSLCSALPSMGADHALRERAFLHRRPGWFQTSSSKCLKKQPQGRCFLVETATNHPFQNRWGPQDSHGKCEWREKAMPPTAAGCYLPTCHHAMDNIRPDGGVLLHSSLARVTLAEGPDPFASRGSLQGQALKCVCLFTRPALCQKVLGTDLASDVLFGLRVPCWWTNSESYFRSVSKPWRAPLRRRTCLFIEKKNYTHDRERRELGHQPPV